MEIRIKGNAHEIYKAEANQGGPFNGDWFDMLEAIAGRVIEVETDHLFKDQFNTVPIEGVSSSGMRIMASSVDEVIDDEREYMLRCTYCGQASEVSYVDSLRCPHCGQGDYLVALSNSAEISWQYRIRAKAERAAGGSCEVDERMGTVAVKLSDGSEYFFQGEESDNMIDEYNDIEWLSCTIEEYFLAVAQGW